jgi:hypothetical protein
MSLDLPSSRLSNEENEVIDEIRRLFEAADTDGNQRITVGKLTCRLPSRSRSASTISPSRMHLTPGIKHAAPPPPRR